ncbi:DUF2478 domain-containing protein [Tropicimonas sp. TH_r6]|uniref:DUF2478 domain-containing protein n=1 Tax=Tropicimonas sp. TH_r6 TaxID=3082085 RepID=UPI0029537DB2|nr:DUF2478 domain-containing protein [Tropicimonas sp. TH_r6]MDV7144407.1 DUF2478 domain-containing protein [Tropicimonas sp. TH_r6]
MKLAHIRSETPGEINETLRALARHMNERGARVVGGVQVNRAATSADAPSDMDLELLPDGKVIRISQRLGPGSSGCRLDPAQLETAVGICSGRLANGADLLIVNKFGAHEAEGRGFRDLIGQALAEDVPVVVGVASAKLPAFRDFVGDLSQELPCELDALRAWCLEETNSAQ